MVTDTYTLKYDPEKYFKKYGMKKKRQEHSFSVAHEMVKFAQYYNVDEEKAYVAGIFHDIARDISIEEILIFSKAVGHIPDRYEEAQPVNLHSFASCYILENEDITHDTDILTAVSQHTYGYTGMGVLSSLLYILDFAEPTRHFKEAETAYHLLKKNIDDALIYVITQTWGFIAEEKRLIHPISLELYNSLVLKYKRNRSRIE